MRLHGIGDQPLTFSVSAKAHDAGTQFAIEQFPAILRTKHLGDATTLFVHGQSYDQPFIIDTAGPWAAWVSSNIHLDLRVPGDHYDRSIVDGTAALSGTLECDGLRAQKLDLQSQLTRGVAFPSGAFPQQLPEQEIRLTIDTGDAASLRLRMNTVITDSLTIASPSGPQHGLDAALCSGGLRLADVLITTRTHPGDVREVRGSCVMDAAGDLTIDGAGL
jgi:hypothetical protein